MKRVSLPCPVLSCRAGLHDDPNCRTVSFHINMYMHKQALSTTGDIIEPYDPSGGNQCAE